jgi:predicted nuclease of predicted toxin-antitoxin system
LEGGYDILPLRECIPPDSPDDIVIETAQKLDRILISLNGDFADIITYPPSKYKGILSLQVRNHPEIIPDIITILKRYLEEFRDMRDYKGKLILVEPHRIRVRK